MVCLNNNKSNNQYFSYLELTADEGALYTDACDATLWLWEERASVTDDIPVDAPELNGPWFLLAIPGSPK